MNAITACFWTKTKQDTGYRVYISYAVSHTIANQFLILGHAGLRLIVEHGEHCKKVSM